MTSSIGNMIISIIDYNACTYGDNANITSFSALVIDIRSTLCEANLNHPLYKGGPITLTTFPLMLGVGYPICWGSSILWALTTCPCISISILWCWGGGQCEICLTLWKLFTTPIFGIILKQLSTHLRGSNPPPRYGKIYRFYLAKSKQKVIWSYNKALLNLHLFGFCSNDFQFVRLVREMGAL
jgi:hypothetical protein